MGSYFDNTEWSNSKTSILSVITREKYPLARISTSQATVNPDKHTADLNVIVEDKQPVYFGDFEISGTKRCPISVVQDLTRLRPGSPCDSGLLLDFQQALEQNSYYSGASVQANFSNMKNDHVPVKVNVSEAKLRKLETGVRYDPEYDLGDKIDYDYYNLFNHDYIGSVVQDMDKYETTLAAGVSQPRNSDGKYWTTDASYNRPTIRSLRKHALTTGVWRVRDRNGIKSRLGLEFITEDHKVPDTNYDLGRSHATMLAVPWKRQNIETELRPENGYYLDGKTGATLGGLFSSIAMARAVAKAGYLFTPENKKIGVFVVRGQTDYVYAKEGKEVPSSLEFRAGDTSSMRRYELDNIGKAGPDGSVLPERALLIGSLGYQFPLIRNLSGAVFHDVGDTAVNFKKMTTKHDTGPRVRWFSPIAPSAFGIACGHQGKKIHWHINLDTRF